MSLFWRRWRRGGLRFGVYFGFVEPFVSRDRVTELIGEDGSPLVAGSGVYEAHGDAVPVFKRNADHFDFVGRAFGRKRVALSHADSVIPGAGARGGSGELFRVKGRTVSRVAEILEKRAEAGRDSCDPRRAREVAEAASPLNARISSEVDIVSNTESPIGQTAPGDCDPVG